MEKPLMSKFSFDDYKIDLIKYKYNSHFEFKEPLEVKSSIKVDINSNEGNSSGSVTIYTKIFENAEKQNYPFSLEVSITGFFSTQEKLSNNELYKLLEVNGSAVLFPFLRSAIADITKTANVDTLIMPLININALIEKHKGEKPNNKPE